MIQKFEPAEKLKDLSFKLKRPNFGKYGWSIPPLTSTSWENRWRHVPIHLHAQASCIHGCSSHVSLLCCAAVTQAEARDPCPREAPV